MIRGIFFVSRGCSLPDRIRCITTTMCLIIYGCFALKDHLVYFASAKNTPVPRNCESIHYSTATYCSVRSPFVMQIGVRHKYFILLCLYSDDGSAKYYAALPGLCWLLCCRLCRWMQTCVCLEDL